MTENNDTNKAAVQKYEYTNDVAVFDEATFTSQVVKTVSRMIKSGFTPFNPDAIMTEEELVNCKDQLKLATHRTEIAKAVTVAQKAKELNIPILTAFDGLYPIKQQSGGLKIGMMYHLINAIVHRAGCKVEFIQDFNPSYKYMTRTRKVYDTYENIPTKEENGKELKPKLGQFLNKDFCGNPIPDYVQDANGIYAANIYDGDVALFLFKYTTTCRITRYREKFTEVQEYSYDSFEDARIINEKHKGVPPTNRMYYKTYYRKCAFLPPARMICPTELQGMYDIGELLEAEGKDYNMTEDGEVTEILN